MRVCVFVETFEIFKYICTGLKMQCNLVPHLSYCRPYASPLETGFQTVIEKISFNIWKLYLSLFKNIDAKIPNQIFRRG